MIIGLKAKKSKKVEKPDFLTLMMVQMRFHSKWNKKEEEYSKEEEEEDNFGGS